MNFARFMASVDQRFAEQGTRIERRFAALEVRIEKRFAEVDTRFADLRADLLKWVFIYRSGTMLAMAGFVFAVLQGR